MTTNQPKKIIVNSSTLVDLKAELLRKQQEYRKEKSVAGLPVSQRRNKNEKEKGSIWSKANAGVLERAQRDIEAKKEEDATLEKSRSTLEAKAKLYERITNSNDIPEDDNGELFLVDFQRKALNDRLQERLEERAKDEKRDLEETNKRLNEPIPVAAAPEEDWVDYVDQYGKSRRCLRKDLEDLKGLVKPLKISGESELLSEDMKRELLREKWEQEEEDMLNGPTGPVHYSNVQFDEIRSHGVAFYQFSKDQEERESQMERLQQLREQTTVQREKKEKLKEKRKAIMATRLAKVKQRRMITTTIDSDSDEKEEELEEKKEVKVAEPIVRDDSWRKSAPVREWDMGKKDDVDWLHHQRTERIVDFAPPSFYFDSSSTKHPATKSDKDQVPTDVNKIESQVDSLLNQIRSGAAPSGSTASHDNSNVADIPLPQEKQRYSGLETKNLEMFSELPQVASSQDSFVPAEAAMPPLPGVFYPNPWGMLPAVSFQQQMTSPPPGYPNYAYPVEPQTSNDTSHNAVPSQEPSHLVESLPVQNQDYSSAENNVSEETAQPTASDQTAESSLKNVPSSYSSQPVRYAQPGMELGQQEDGIIVAPAPQKTAYQRVNLHEVPRSLPNPPSSTNKPSYPSQENVVAMSERNAEKNWMKQFRAPQKQEHDTKITLPKTDKIPFQSPYVQKSDGSSEPFKSEISFDPSKPPPSLANE